MASPHSAWRRRRAECARTTRTWCRSSSAPLQLELVGEGAEYDGRPLRGVAIGVTAGAIGVLHVVEQPDGVLDDDRHLLRRLPLGVALRLRLGPGHRRRRV